MAMFRRYSRNPNLSPVDNRDQLPLFTCEAPVRVLDLTE